MGLVLGDWVCYNSGKLDLIVDPWVKLLVYRPRTCWKTKEKKDRAS